MRKIQVSVAGVSTLVAENLLTQKSNGDYEKHYNADMSLETATIDAEALAKLIQDGETLVESIVDGYIDVYNKANGVNFGSVENCFTYSFDLEYEHQPFCNNICAYKISIWKTARANQAIAIAENWDEQTFFDSLPKFGV